MTMKNNAKFEEELTCQLKNGTRNLTNFDPNKNLHFNAIQDGGATKKTPPTSFSPVTSTNVGTCPQNFLTFSFNSFNRLV